VKPFDRKILLAQVKGLLENRRRLMQHYSDQILIEPAGITVPSQDKEFLESMRRSVEGHMDEADFSVGTLADDLCIGQRQLQRKVKSLLGMTPVNYIRVLRMKRAAQLLDVYEGTINEIARMVGYRQQGYFAKNFAEFFGQTPTEYRGE
jgi:transcriptional regulator GlxA family with amidase domain